MRSAEEIREHLITDLNTSLRRPGMYGGWPVVWSFEHTLGFVDGSDDPIKVLDRNARIPAGFVGERVADPDESFFHALYIPAYHQRGWFRPDTVLDPAAHKAFLDGLDLWLADPHTRADVLEALGSPSWRHGAVLAYVTADPADPVLVLSCLGDTVLAAWTSERAFPAGLRLTAAGKARLAAQPTP